MPALTGQAAADLERNLVDGLAADGILLIVKGEENLSGLA